MSAPRTDIGGELSGAWGRLPTRGRVAAGLLVLLVVVLAWSLWGFARALIAPSAEAQANAKGDDERNKAYQETFPGRIAQIDGRSLFLTPGPPVDPEAERKKKEEEAAKAAASETTETPKPTSYGGPGMIAMINGVAWFDDGKRLSEGAAPVADLKVVRLMPPWEAVVEWKGVEFTVGLFPRDSIVIDPKRDEDAKKKADERAKATNQDVQVVKGNA